MSEKLRVASTRDIDEGRALMVEVRGKRLALFRYRGHYFALDDACSHRGGSLHEGCLHQAIVTCPWHQWQFDIRTGVSPLNPLSRVRGYRTHVEDGDLFVEID